MPRNSTYEPSAEDCPVPLEHLGKTRSTFFGDTSYHDRWHTKNNKTFSSWWTGTTRFKILPTFRKTTHDVFYNVSDGYSTYVEPKAKDKNNLDERKMSLADRLSFTEAKRKELTSFFEHDVWEFCDPQNADSSRILKAHLSGLPMLMVHPEQRQGSSLKAFEILMHFLEPFEPTHRL